MDKKQKQTKQMPMTQGGRGIRERAGQRSYSVSPLTGAT